MAKCPLLPFLRLRSTHRSAALHMTGAMMLAVVLAVVLLTSQCLPGAASAFVHPPLRLSRINRGRLLSVYSQITGIKSPTTQGAGKQRRIADVDKELGSFERDRFFMAKYKKFEALKQKKRQLIQQTKDPLKEAGAVALAFLLGLVGMVLWIGFLLAGFNWAFQK
ncbi:unnamed protein product [Vitrella brassicaformis CCMP3155]|uniref:Transmembrane protein n=2 Tax=Vitrella brassicaformis TaxID=1169539 RepID=A0A0G4GB14_VITBC|nr:unnamed protein product [Vitrella brassicaformis CCMP3155]|eukprot:CEM26335.1 unnamed protein product [Vitrella brassicaformis CCMP3155]